MMLYTYYIRVFVLQQEDLRLYLINMYPESIIMIIAVKIILESSLFPGIMSCDQYLSIIKFVLCERFVNDSHSDKIFLSGYSKGLFFSFSGQQFFCRKIRRRV